VKRDLQKRNSALRYDARGNNDFLCSLCCSALLHRVLLQCVAVCCCRVLQCVVAVLQCVVAECCSVLMQCVAVCCCRVLQCVVA